jgi:hypothetical protein
VLGPHRQVGDRWHATGRQPVGAKVQCNAMPALHIRKNFYRSVTSVERDIVHMA